MNAFLVAFVIRLLYHFSKALCTTVEFIQERCRHAKKNMRGSIQHQTTYDDGGGLRKYLTSYNLSGPLTPGEEKHIAFGRTGGLRSGGKISSHFAVEMLLHLKTGDFETTSGQLPHLI